MIRSLGLGLAALALATSSALGASVEGQIEIPGGPGPLKGTLATPEGGPKGPAILILAGSGPTDRDGNNRLGVRAAPYRLLAEGLAAEGITTLRVDKRGLFGSASATDDPNAVTVSVLAVDAKAWAARLKAETGAPCVWLLGHSEGGLVALIAAQDGQDICGVLLVSAPGRRLADVLREQLQANPANAPVLPQAMKALADLEAGRRTDTTGMHPALLPLFHDKVQGFLIELFRQDPGALAAATLKPILILQGETDLQITIDDAKAFKAAQPKATLVVLPQVNHALKTAPADRAANFATYADPDLPLAPGVVKTIVDFVRAQPGMN